MPDPKGKAKYEALVERLDELAVDVRNADAWCRVVSLSLVVTPWWC
jgi:hypothetical protein